LSQYTATRLKFEPIERRYLEEKDRYEKSETKTKSPEFEKAEIAYL